LGGDQKEAEIIYNWEEETGRVGITAILIILVDYKNSEAVFPVLIVD
jgi:hypothetical protein